MNVRGDPHGDVGPVVVRFAKPYDLLHAGSKASKGRTTWRESRRSAV